MPYGIEVGNVRVSYSCETVEIRKSARCHVTLTMEEVYNVREALCEMLRRFKTSKEPS